MKKSLAGKVALVTGGARGIGEAIARRLAADGADVAISYSVSADRAASLVKELRAMGIRAAAFRADQAVEEQISSLVRMVSKQFGRLDILVNNAGTLATGLVSDPAADMASFSRQYAVNVAGAAAAVRAAVPLISDKGRIISIGSGLADRAVWQGMGDYSATKAAIAAYSRAWAHDLASRGITVNTVQPGPIDTEMNPEDGEFAKRELPSIPMGRFGRPEEVAYAVSFLASPEASYITGVSLNVDGGVMAA